MTKDWTQDEDVATKYAEKVKEMKELFATEARKYEVLPLDASVPSFSSGPTQRRRLPRDWSRLPVCLPCQDEIQCHRGNPVGLIRSSYREHGKVKHSTHGRITGLTLEQLQLLQAAFRGDVVPNQAS